MYFVAAANFTLNVMTKDLTPMFGFDPDVWVSDQVISPGARSADHDYLSFSNPCFAATGLTCGKYTCFRL